MMAAGVIAIVWRDRRFDPERSTQVVLSDDERAVLVGAADAKSRQVAVERRSAKKKVKTARRARDSQAAEGNDPGSGN
jgi:hypothetical protein